MQDDFDFGLLTPWVQDDRITDINYNGKQIWIDHLEKGRYPIDPFTAHDFMQALAYKIANYVNLPFNISAPILEAETKDLRLSMLHQSVCRSGLSISIRKTPALMRINDAMMKSYAPAWVTMLLTEAIKGRSNILISGLPGSGKTELVKYLMKNIPAHQRVITIEDSLELRYGEIHPHKDHVMIKISPLFDYEAAIKAALRQRPDWICVSEVRGREVMALIQSCSTGASVLSTVHAENAHSIPQRLLHMMPDVDVTNTSLLAVVHSTLDLGIHLEIQSSPKGIRRKIKEIVYFYLDDQFKPKTMLIYDDQGDHPELSFHDLPKKGIHHDR